MAEGLREPRTVAGAGKPQTAALISLRTAALNSLRMAGLGEQWPTSLTGQWWTQEELPLLYTVTHISSGYSLYIFERSLE